MTAAAPVRAMVLAAGLGTRLQPLTDTLPKPAVPVVHRPVVGYLLHALAAAGVREVILNTHHLPGPLMDLIGDGAAYGISTEWSHEPSILGTGGAVREVAAFLGEGTCLLLNGDFLIEVDLARVLEGHRAALQADPRVVATLVCREDPAADRYGALGIAADGRIVDFVGRARVPGAQVAWRGLFTGIHVLEPALRAAIPPEGAPCINRTAYPAMIDAGAVVRAHLQRGHWSDIGTPGGYLQANLDVLEGRVTMAGPDPRSEGARFIPAGGRARMGGGQVIGPASVAHGAAVGEGAEVGPGVVLGEGAAVGAGARIARAVVWPGGAIPAGAHLDGAVAWREAGAPRVLETSPSRGDPGR